MEAMMKGQINELKQTMEATNQNLQNQIGQMENELNMMKSQQGSTNLPTQTVINPQNVSAITLRSGKQIQGLGDAQEDEDKENEVIPDNESGRSDEATQVTSVSHAPSDNSSWYPLILPLKILLLILLLPIQTV